ncbi:hypothetical protein ABIE40_005733 [Rhizobium sp. OAE497]|jgi:hypothetical protein
MTPAVTRPPVIQLWSWNQKSDGVQWEHHEKPHGLEELRAALNAVTVGNVAPAG